MLLGEIEGLDANPVAYQEYGILPRVPQGEREHADATMEGRLETPVLDSRKKNLGVAVAPESMPEQYEFVPKNSIVIDLAVEGNHQSPTGRHHRLLAGRREIDDAEPTV